MSKQQSILYRGQQYTFYEHKITKTGAKGVVDRLRKNGYKTRTIDCGNGEYDVYITKR